jgi:catechol 2,3-dioxygenase
MVELGYVAIRVRDLEQGLRFYRDAVGLRVVGRLAGGRAAVLSGGRQHHELLLVAAAALSEAGSPCQPLYHTAWRVGEGLDALREAKTRLDALGIAIDGAVNHGVSFSLYLRDPEGNQVELFADNPDIDWRGSDAWTQGPSVPMSL